MTPVDMYRDLTNQMTVADYSFKRQEYHQLKDLRDKIILNEAELAQLNQQPNTGYSLEEFIGGVKTLKESLVAHRALLGL